MVAFCQPTGMPPLAKAGMAKPAAQSSKGFKLAPQKLGANESKAMTLRSFNKILAAETWAPFGLLYIYIYIYSISTFLAIFSF